ncbi:MAG: Mur ligase family protein, partial [Phycisphaerales bacterium]
MRSDTEPHPWVFTRSSEKNVAMSFWTPESLRAACGGSWIVRPPQIELPKDRPADLPLPPLHAPITGLSTDTRTLRPGQVFLALRGERFDGHGFLKVAAAGGAPILIVDEAGAGLVPAGGYEPQAGVMRVADTGKALLRIAAAYRRTLERVRVIAVCGSNGKTTTAGLIRQMLLACGLRGTASHKSFNNAIGVPLTILGAQPTDQFLVCEVGTNAPGEIAALAEVVNPDIAVITSIGREHLEKLGDIAGVAREEASVLKHLRPPPKGCAIVTADAPELAEHVKGVANLITFGRNPEATLRLTAVGHASGPDGRVGVEFTINGRLNARLEMLGVHNALNALAAFAVARRMGADDARALAAMARASGPEMRLERMRVGG